MPTDPVKAALDATTYQLTQCVKGMPESAMDARATPDGMTPRDMLEHLCECYEAYMAICDGKQWNWGSYKAPDRATAPLVETWKATRQKAVSRCLGSDDAQARENAMHYIALHDAYHVGQLCLIRLAAQPEWDAHSIYRE